MVLYELVCISRLAKASAQKASSMKPTDGIKDFVIPLVRSSSIHILDRGGVVRGFQKLTPSTDLPFRMKKHQEIFSHGCKWTMQFDSSPETMLSLQKSLDFDERVIRHTVVKLGDKLKKLAKFAPPQ
ncbi:hypothetical protein HDV05_008318 [Chytridiales sp. JEL 0842]|nr:hypothetical protein HDV05_008318 [Chytridiales sp. JEL 0842]